MLACPRCACQLRAVRYGRAAAYRCPRCTGHAITYPVVREALQRGRWLRLWRNVLGGTPGSGVACPACGKGTAQVVDQGVVLDSCRGCYRASAGISAVLFYYAFRFPKARIGWALRYWIVPVWWFRMTARTAFGLWLALQVFLAMLQSKGLTNVSAMGHLGGVLAGLLFVVAQRTSAAPER